ncbi:hypothetical protein [Aeromonas dhakensis]|uniref:hypothetical protein n=1 Tax=Aeromonas dhakensis TaxID=196024 RepID=UPI003BA1C68C
MLEDALNSIKAHLYDRAVSPLMGSIIVSWVVWNYKLPLLLISKEPILEKYRIISEVLYATNASIYLNGLLYPILTAATYIFIYPYPAEFVFKFTRNRQKSISNIKRQIEGEALLTVKESMELRREIDKLEDEFMAILGKKEAEIEKLRNELNEMNVQGIGANTSSKEEGKKINSNKALNDTEHEILQLLDDSNASESTIIAIFEGRRSSNWVKYHIEKLEKLGLIRSATDDFGDDEWTITYNGRTYLIENQLDFENYALAQ